VRLLACVLCCLLSLRAARVNAIPLWCSRRISFHACSTWPTQRVVSQIVLSSVIGLPSPLARRRSFTLKRFTPRHSTPVSEIRKHFRCLLCKAPALRPHWLHTCTQLMDACTVRLNRLVCWSMRKAQKQPHCREVFRFVSFDVVAHHAQTTMLCLY